MIHDFDQAPLLLPCPPPMGDAVETATLQGSAEFVEVWEGPKSATPKGPFYYFAKGHQLLPISTLAQGGHLTLAGTRHLVPFDHISGVTFFQFVVTNAGRLEVNRVLGDQFVGGRPKTSEPIADWRDALRGARFRAQAPQEPDWSNLFDTALIPMGRDVRRFLERFRLRARFPRMRRVHDFLEDPEASYYQLLCPPDPAYRAMAIQDLRKKLFHVWTFTQIAEALGVTQFLPRAGKRASILDFRRGGATGPTAVAETAEGALSFWFAPDRGGAATPNGTSARDHPAGAVWVVSRGEWDPVLPTAGGAPWELVAVSQADPGPSSQRGMRVASSTVMEAVANAPRPSPLEINSMTGENTHEPPT